MAKTIIIDTETHSKLKEYCSINSIKLNSWVNILILKKLEEIDELSKDI
jgi:hypothetical protein